MAVGVIRFDIEGSSAEISIYLDPDQRGRGLGPATLAAGSAWIGVAREQVTRLTAVISDENAASLRAFEKAGFRRAGNVWICEIGGSARVSRVEG
jgi:RimJ/RimL family protein N-acetyltransferase